MNSGDTHLSPWWSRGPLGEGFVHQELREIIESGLGEGDLSLWVFCEENLEGGALMGTLKVIHKALLTDIFPQGPHWENWKGGGAVTGDFRRWMRHVCLHRAPLGDLGERSIDQKC
jgi:hypothetical protein